LERGPAEPVFVDSGGTFGVAVTLRRYRKAYGKPPSAKPERGHSAVASIRFQRFPVSAFSLGAVECHELDGVLGVFDEHLGERLGLALHLLASHDFLSRFDVTYDYSSSQLWFASGSG